LYKTAACETLKRRLPLRPFLPTHPRHPARDAGPETHASCPIHPSHSCPRA
jgi:hypothetical protein